MTDAALPRILVVEDNPTNRVVISAMLSGHAEVDLAEDGRGGLEKLAGGDYDGALVDIRMPVMDGETMVARWREVEAREGRPRLAIAACTSNVQPGEIRRIEAAGFDRHIEKPIMIPRLRAIVDWMAGAAPEAAGGPAAGKNAPRPDAAA
jgi:two-component system sensor histidine kinase EvgS